jgi:hypothetical protein
MVERRFVGKKRPARIAAIFQIERDRSQRPAIVITIIQAKENSPTRNGAEKLKDE